MSRVEQERGRGQDAGRSPVSVAGVVTLFHPSAEVVENIGTYLHDLQVLFVVDNTPEPDQEIARRLQDLEGVEYSAFLSNEGVATALNLGASKAAARGCGLLLTMDQDTRALPGMVDGLVRCIEAEPDAAMVSAACVGRDEVGRGYYPADFAITAGSMVRIGAWEDVGPFLDELFIDLVDTEYCMRLRRHGYRLLHSKEALQLHEIGAPTRHRWFLFGQITVGNHDPARSYYLWRNAMHLKDVYGEALPKWFRGTWRTVDAVLMLLYEPHRADKIRMILRAVRDHRRRLLGRYPDRLVDARPVLDRLRRTGRPPGEDGPLGPVTDRAEGAATEDAAAPRTMSAGQRSDAPR